MEGSQWDSEGKLSAASSTFDRNYHVFLKIFYTTRVCRNRIHVVFFYLDRHINSILVYFFIDSLS